GFYIHCSHPRTDEHGLRWRGDRATDSVAPEDRSLTMGRLMNSRRTLCSFFSLLTAIWIVTQLAAQSTKPMLPSSGGFVLGADVSLLADLEQRGAVYHDLDHAMPGNDALPIFAHHGWNCFRLRLFVNPNGRGGVVNSLEYTRALAKRIKRAGAIFILDL